MSASNTMIMDTIKKFIYEHKVLTIIITAVTLWVSWIVIVGYRDNEACSRQVSFRGNTSAGYYEWDDETRGRFETEEKAIEACVKNRSDFRNYYGY